MTQQVFAQFIEVSPATLSSIYNGRNKPTLNILEAIKKKIPDISTEWLLFGTGTMYGTTGQSTPPPSAVPTPNHQQSSQPSSPMLDFDTSPSPAPEMTPPTIYPVNSVKSTRAEIERTEVKVVDKPQRRVKEVRVFYDDQTFEVFVPEKK